MPSLNEQRKFQQSSGQIKQKTGQQNFGLGLVLDSKIIIFVAQLTVSGRFVIRMTEDQFVTSIAKPEKSMLILALVGYAHWSLVACWRIQTQLFIGFILELCGETSTWTEFLLSGKDSRWWRLSGSVVSVWLKIPLGYRRRYFTNIAYIFMFALIRDRTVLI